MLYETAQYILDQLSLNFNFKKLSNIPLSKRLTPPNGKFSMETPHFCS